MLASQALPVCDEEHERLMKCARRGEVTAITGGPGNVLAGYEPGSRLTGTLDRRHV
jgi:hypothetical protein